MEIYETQAEIGKRKSWLLSLVVIVLVGFGVLILLQSLALALAVPLFDLSISQIMSLMSGDSSIPNGRMAMLFIQGIGSGIGFWFAAWIIIKWIDKAELNWDLQISRFGLKKFWVMVAITLGAMFFNGLLVYWNSQLVLPESLSALESWMKAMEDQLMQLTQFLTDFQSVPELLTGLLVIGVLAGI
ncbi:MAG TPA: CPBP family intramembrane metalloprotease domain-containing protein, partial [Algoriphagus sp.]|nr:CPBP family intramembrane metalloprotease domain-containing protein [Algoriphagus sp.]